MPDEPQNPAGEQILRELREPDDLMVSVVDRAASALISHPVVGYECRAHHAHPKFMQVIWSTVISDNPPILNSIDSIT